MEKSHQVTASLSEGLSLSDIASRYGVSLGDVIKAVEKEVHAGRLLKSQVQPALNQDWLRDLGSLAKHWQKLSAEKREEMVKLLAPDCELDREGVEFYITYAGKEFRAGEIYELLCEIERTLHAEVRRALVEHYGSKETEWWREGVKETVRVACHRARETDSGFSEDEPYAYTTLIDLKDILDDQWKLFQGLLPKNATEKKPELMKELQSLNAIRNRVMHPVRSKPPTEKDFILVKRMWETLHISKWRKVT